MAKQIEVSTKFLKKIDDVIDDLIQIIDHDTDSIDSFTTVPARKLLIEISELLKE
jgi:hypothetical protein